MKTQSLLFALSCATLLNGCNSANLGQNILNQSVNSALNTANPAYQTPAAPGAAGPAGSIQAVTYKNTSRNYSFTIPAGWTKQE